MSLIKGLILDFRGGFISNLLNYFIVLQRCVWHCGGSGRCARDAAAAHYRAVCRALVAEALELGTFLARVRVGGARDMGAAEESVTHLDTLQFSDWVRNMLLIAE